MKFLFLFILLASKPANSDVIATDQTDYFKGPSMQGAVGESSNLFLLPEGYYFHPIYNDVNGNTDKFLTASSKLGALFEGRSSGFELAFYWRLLTPAVKPAFSHKDLDRPVGIYADWNEAKMGYSWVSSKSFGRIRQQVAVSYSDISNKGGRDFHRGVHKITKNSLENLDYTNQPEGRFYSRSYTIGLVNTWIFSLHDQIDTLISFNFKSDKMMQESSLIQNSIWTLRKNYWALAAELKVTRQFNSEVYEAPKLYRYEVGIGTQLYGVYTPMIRYVSSYLKGDDIGQTYFDFIHFNWRI